MARCTTNQKKCPECQQPTRLCLKVAPRNEEYAGQNPRQEQLNTKNTDSKCLWQQVRREGHLNLAGFRVNA